MRKALPAAIVVISALTLAGCGLENIPYLSPPAYSSPASTGTPLFVVSNPARDAGEVLVFRGFELYYKLFSSDQSTERNIQSGLSTREQILQTYGFKRMCTAGTQTQVLPFLPVDAVDRGTEFDIVLDFNLPFNNSLPTMEYQGGSIPPTPPHGTIRREATESGEPKTFAWTEFDSGDSDLAGINWAVFSVDGILDLVVYAVSYGLSDYSAIYSTPWPLGYMTYDF